MLMVGCLGFVTVGSCRQSLAAAAPRTKATQSAKSQQDWPAYGGSPSRDHYSPLTQINRSNVSQLKEVWRYVSKGKGSLETTPLMINGVLYGISPTQEVFALNAATGKPIWTFDPGMASDGSRGLAYWSNGRGDGRLFVGVMYNVYAIDARTGKAIRSFGDNGHIDLRENLGRDPKSQWISLTSPGIVYKDLIIVGGEEPETLPAPPGDIRAYDVRTGKLRWTFHTIPHPGEYGYNTWPKNAWKYSGAANCWGGMSLDSKRGIVYVPTGSAAPDFYGASRIGDDLFADTLIALNAETGKRIWSFQDVRHDIWDRDLPAAPALVTLHRDGKAIPALAQVTKQGFLYVFNRVNGKSLFPIVYRKVPASTVPGEVAASEQPFPLEPAPFARQRITADTLTNRTPEAHQYALKLLRTARSGGQFTPLSVGKPTLIVPGTHGGGNWGGPAVDPKTGILYVNSTDQASIDSLKEYHEAPTGRGTYMSQCSVCHGSDLSGSPPSFPSLVDIGKKLSDPQITARIHQGGGRMPGFANIQGDQLKALIAFLHHPNKHEGDGNIPAGSVSYQLDGYKDFVDAQGYPAVATPWGTLSAINLNTGKYLWKVPFGQYPELVAEGKPDTGSVSYGGPIVTAGGLVIIAATVYDHKIRAYDKDTGKLLWQAVLPNSGSATPATYMVDGRQYIVIASGSGMLLHKSTPGIYVAFALPKAK